MGRGGGPEHRYTGKLYESDSERGDREWREAQQEIADLRHRCDVLERTAKAAANLLLRKPR